MSLRAMPEIRAFQLPDVSAYRTDDAIFSKWDASLTPAATSENTITILDMIGESPWSEGGVTSKRIAAALRSIGDGDVVVEINSPGGDFFEGVAIYNMLRAHAGKVEVRILGLAASAASVIAMAGDQVLIGEAGFLMVHNCWVGAVGNRHDLSTSIEIMEKFDASMAEVYAARAGVGVDVAASWMDDETWFGGAEAVENGLADALLDADQVATSEAGSAQGNKEVRRVDSRLSQQGLPRSERRAPLGGVKGATQDAGARVTHDADAIAALCEGLFKL